MIKKLLKFPLSLISYLYNAHRCKHVNFFNYKELVKHNFKGPLFFTSVCLYGNYKAVARLQHKRFNFFTDYLEHGVCFINTPDSARLLGYIDRKFVKNVYTYGSFRSNLIKAYLEKNNYRKRVVEVGPYILGAEHFYSKEKLKELKQEYGKILLVYPQHSIENYHIHYNIDEIIKEINGRKSNFDNVFVCLYWKDIWDHPEYIERYQKEGFVVVTNGHRNDPKFLSRQKDLISLSDMMLTNGIGTHIGYSIALGKPVYLYRHEVSAKDDRNAQEVYDLTEMEHRFCKVFQEFSWTITEPQRALVEEFWGKF